eukprot:TRINITY_DN2559_c0_g1_i7.p1 TRINITY_DN2559_c0_g1~~TRINITY_DN2559_c0_g1_i7.p1  ORF type:complete len:204 (+),score=43.60 TRINITY_DN2559_c0_g1_i7:171-782(+)
MIETSPVKNFQRENSLDLSLKLSDLEPLKEQKESILNLSQIVNVREDTNAFDCIYSLELRKKTDEGLMVNSQTFNENINPIERKLRSNIEKSNKLQNMNLLEEYNQLKIEKKVLETRLEMLSRNNAMHESERNMRKEEVIYDLKKKLEGKDSDIKELKQLIYKMDKDLRFEKLRMKFLESQETEKPQKFIPKPTEITPTLQVT